MVCPATREELEDLSSYELLARYDNTGGKYHRLFAGPPMVPHYAPFLEARHSVPPSECKRVKSAKDLATSTRKHEEYCEQRLVMFRPYRQRLQLLDGHKSFSAAMFAWLAEEGNDRGKETVQYELKVTRHRLRLVEEFQLQFGVNSVKKATMSPTRKARWRQAARQTTTIRSWPFLVLGRLLARMTAAAAMALGRTGMMRSTVRRRIGAPPNST